MKTFWITFLTLFVAELGDKTQLAVITLTSKTGSPLLVFLGAASALVIVTLLGVVAGQALIGVVPEAILKKIAALAFIVIGILMFWGKM